MSEKLKPCPFCGGKAEHGWECDEFENEWHYVSCKKGCIEGSFATGKTKEEAIKAWNKRPSPWHTGMPTEEGWYLITDGQGNYDVTYWFIAHVEDEEDNEGEWDSTCLDKIVAYQKIEPYKESK